MRLFDVIQVNESDLIISVLAENQGLENAITRMYFAVINKWIIGRFFVIVPAGSFKNGDVYVFS